MSWSVMQKKWFTIFKTKVTARACIIWLWLFLLYFLNCWSFQSNLVNLHQRFRRYCLDKIWHRDRITDGQTNRAMLIHPHPLPIANLTHWHDTNKQDEEVEWHGHRDGTKQNATDTDIPTDANLTHRHDIDVEDEEVEPHGQAYGTHQPQVDPWRHHDQWLVLTQAEKPITSRLTCTDTKHAGMVDPVKLVSHYLLILSEPAEYL